MTDFFLKDIVADIGWIDRSFPEHVEFDSCDYSSVEEDSVVTLEGYSLDKTSVISVTVKIESVEITPYFEDEGYDIDLDEEEDE